MTSLLPSLPENPNRQQQAAYEEYRRRLARQNLLAFTQYTFPDYEVNWHHRILADKLTKFATGEIKRLIVLMHPRAGKTELVSRRLPAFILGCNPDAHFMGASYSADFASDNNRRVQRIMDSPEYSRLFPATKLYGKNIRSTATGSYLRNADVFEIVNHKGSYRGVGVGGAATGFGFDHAALDDPIKNRQEANSLTYRNSVWDWFRAVFYTRQEKNAGILITVTPWHEDDVVHRILNLAASDPQADQWEVIRFPAQAEEPLSPEDPRDLGEWLWPAKFTPDTYRTLRATIGGYEWNALYQLRPTAPEGNRFKRHWFREEKRVAVAPVKARRIRYWDKAGTGDSGQTTGARTAGVLLAITDNGLVYIEDSVTGYFSSLERELVIKQTAADDARKYQNGVTIWLEQEPGSGGKESAESTIRNLSGYPVYADRPSGDKDTRLEPFAAQAEADNVWLVAGDWNQDWIEEMVAIPNGTRRDQGDATAGAFNKLALAKASMPTRWRQAKVKGR